MLDYPVTLEQAKKYRYRVWGGEPKGIAYVEGVCAYEVWPHRGLPYQCQRQNGHGPDELYCKQHAKKVTR